MSFRDLPVFRDLRAFLRYLEAEDSLRAVDTPVALALELTALHKCVLEAGGPVLRFDRATHEGGTPARMPVIANLFGTESRAAAGLGVREERLHELGEMLAALREPAPLEGLTDALSRWPMLRAALATHPRITRHPACQAEVTQGSAVDLSALPIPTCWPGEPAPLITWPLVITRPPDTPAAATARYNMGVYRLQVLGRNRLIGRWLAHRGGAAHHRAWAARGERMPVAIAIGADPATILSAVLPLPEHVSELRISGVLRGERPHLAEARTVPLLVPADAEIVIEGWVSADETAPEGPYGDHTGYYNAVEPFPVIDVTAITSRSDPLYLTTYTGRPPDEPSIIGAVLNRLVLPLITRQMPEVADLWLPPEACSYRIAIVAIRKRYAGQARRVMMGLWGLLPQFSYTKTIIVVDDDIDVRSWTDVAWAISTRLDPSRDVVIIPDTPIDYLDFASPAPGLGGKMGLDATNKIGPETRREWGRVLTMPRDLEARAQACCAELGLLHRRRPL